MVARFWLSLSRTGQSIKHRHGSPAGRPYPRPLHQNRARVTPAHAPGGNGSPEPNEEDAGRQTTCFRVIRDRGRALGRCFAGQALWPGAGRRRRNRRALGGDGFLLQTLRDTMGSGKHVYGMNRGTVGFLMNEYRADGLIERIDAAVPETINPLVMTAITTDGKESTALAINEVRCSANPIRPPRSGSPWTIRCAWKNSSATASWSRRRPVRPPTTSPPRGRSCRLTRPCSRYAGLSVSPASLARRAAANTASVRFDIIEAEKRPVNAVADHTEVKSVLTVTVSESQDTTATLLFDEGHSRDERILTEQFRY